MMDKLYTIVGIISVTILLGLFTSLPVYLLWNSCLVGAIEGVNVISWLQAWGLMILFNILFKLKMESNSGK